MGIDTLEFSAGVASFDLENLSLCDKGQLDLFAGMSGFVVLVGERGI